MSVRYQTSDVTIQELGCPRCCDSLEGDVLLPSSWDMEAKQFLRNVGTVAPACRELYHHSHRRGMMVSAGHVTMSYFVS
jgi:hypothetical protein